MATATKALAWNNDSDDDGWIIPGGKFSSTSTTTLQSSIDTAKKALAWDDKMAVSYLPANFSNYYYYYYNSSPQSSMASATGALVGNNETEEDGLLYLPA